MKQYITVIHIHLHNKFDLSDSILHCVAMNVQGACRLGHVFGTDDISIKTTCIFGIVLPVIFDQFRERWMTIFFHISVVRAHVSSVEASGIDVMALVKAHKIPYNNGENTISYVALILFNN